MRRIKAADFFSRRMLAKARGNSELWRTQNDNVLRQAGKEAEGHTSWINSRGYREYNLLFGEALGKSLCEEFLQIHSARVAVGRQGERMPLRILDDGAGRGNFLVEIKKMLAERGVPVETTALTLRAPRQLILRRESGELDEIVAKRAEFWRPRKKFDVIISVFGSFEYALPSFREDWLLKFAHCLRKGGLLISGLYWSELKETEKLKQALKKIGFGMKVVPSNAPRGSQLQPYVLIVRRKK